MNQSVASSHSSSDGGKERRAFKRHPVSLRAKLTSSGSSQSDCTVLDYCIGGMAIRTGTIPPLHDQIELNCAVLLDGKEQKLRFSGRVVRHFSDGFGMSFIEPDLSQLQTLHAMVSQSQSENSVSRVNLDSKTYNNQPARKILLKCSQLTSDVADTVIQNFFRSVSDFFFEKAKNTPVINEQNALLQALSVLEQSKKEFIQNYNQGIKDFLAAMTPVMHKVFKQDSQQQNTTPDKLSLVADDEFDHWLSVTNIVNAVDAENREVLNEIERRLGDLFEMRISRENNPYGPGLFASVLEELIEKFNISATSKRTCYSTFRDIYLKFAADLYNNINRQLIDSGVLPVLHYTKGSKTSTSASAAEAEIPRAETEPAPQEQQVAQAVKPASSASSAVAAAAHKTAPQQQASKPVTPGVAAGSVPAQRPVMPVGKGSSVTAPSDLFSLVGELRSLQSHLTQYSQSEHSQEAGVAPAAGVSSVHGQGESAQALPSFTASELLEALSTREFTSAVGSQQGEARHDYQSVIQKILSSKSGGQLSKDIGVRERKVMDVAGNVFSSLMSDMQVSNNIRPWIEKLELPVLKMALLDDGLFLNRDHIVRQVVNRLAELDVLTDSDNAEEQEAVKKAFEWLVNLINKEFNGTPDVFRRASQQLDLLLKVQTNTYERNLKQVVDQVASEEKSSTAVAEKIDDESLEEWARKISRLKEGEWVLFDAKAAHPRRLKVGWIARKTAKYVFVNALGKKESVYNLKQLAEMYRDGNLVVLDGAAEPAMDRAQYSMLQKLHKQLLFQTSHDQLTGLYNRREFEKHIDKAINDAKFSGNKHALLFINLDEFSVINNSCGYQGGDALLREMSAFLGGGVDDNSAIARLGGDEFGILLCGHSIDEALDYIDDKLDKLHDYRFKWDEQKLSISLSAGLVSVTGLEQNLSTILQEAESSCRVAKESGGHRVQVYHSGHARLSHRKAQMEWAVKIDQALDENRFGLRCQRIMPLSSGDTYHDHYEILLTIDEGLGIKSPLQDFIRAAEQYKRMSEVDRWVIKNSFEWISKHKELLSHVQSFSINLSGHSLNDESLLDFIKQQMRATNVPIGKICFEITETLGIANLSDATDFINKLKTTGCLFSLDDFGSGMSSYGYLKSLPVDFLKIDGVFVKDMANNPNDFAVVKSICEIGHFMGKKVIAEFVQDDETIKLLKDIGVDYAQGYAIERPHPLGQLVKTV